MRRYQTLLLFLFVLPLIAPSAGGSGEARGVQFAGDHYKVEGGPRISASAINPVVAPGTSGTLRLVMANDGVVERLVPGLVPQGYEEEAAMEMLAEFGCLVASDLKAHLLSGGPVRILSGPVHLDRLDAGDTASLNYEISIEDGASGPVPLVLEIEYEHQVDVSFSGGTASPLYLPTALRIDLVLSVEGSPPSLELAGTRSDLYPGEEGSISLIIRNAGDETAQNCTARLVAASPFTPLTARSRLGDIPPGGVGVARFDLFMEGSARPQDYSLGCEIECSGGAASLSVPLTVAIPEGWPLIGAPLPAALFGGSALAIFWLLWGRRSRPPRLKNLVGNRR
jgi:hypothetical protein